MEKWKRDIYILLAILVVIVPVGILITWNYGDAWGEWGEVNDPERNITWEPQASYTGLLPDYNVEGWESKLMASIGYWISAIVGLILIAAIFSIYKKAMLAKREENLSENGMEQGQNS